MSNPSDTLILIGPNFQQLPATEILVTVPGGTQTTLGNALLNSGTGGNDDNSVAEAALTAATDALSAVGAETARAEAAEALLLPEAYAATLYAPLTASLSSFGAPTSNIAMAGYTLTGLPQPTAAGQTAEYQWVLNQVSDAAAGIVTETPVRLLAASNIALNGLVPVDGVTPNTGDRVLVVNQTNATQNGSYLAATNAWTRTSPSEMVLGAFWLVQAGSTYQGSQWRLNNTGGIAIGTTAINIQQFGAAALYNAGNGITIVGDAITVKAVPGTGILVGPNGISADTTVLLPLTGGTLSGPLVLSGAPTSALNPATKGYVDASDATLQSAITSAQDTANAAAPLNSPHFTGTVTGPTPAAGSNNNQFATTAYVADLASNQSAGVSSFDTRTGAVFLLTDDVTSALGYTPYSNLNPSNYQTASQVAGSVASAQTTANTALSAANQALAATVAGNIASLDLLANTSNIAAAPTGTTLTALLDAAIGNTVGGILFRGSSAWTILGPGVAGDYLVSGGLGGSPYWLAPTGTPPITAPGACTLAFGTATSNTQPLTISAASGTVTQYVIMVSPNANMSAAATYSSTTLTTTVTGLQPSTTYYYTITAYDSTTAGPTSAVVSNATAAATVVTMPTPTVSPSGTVVLAGSTGSIYDAHGNTWTISSGGQVSVNGTADTTTSNVAEIAYVGGLIYYETTAGIWYDKTLPSQAWVQTVTPFPLDITGLTFAADTVQADSAVGTIVGTLTAVASATLMGVGYAVVSVTSPGGTSTTTPVTTGSPFSAAFSAAFGGASGTSTSTTSTVDPFSSDYSSDFGTGPTAITTGDPFTTDYSSAYGAFANTDPFSTDYSGSYGSGAIATNATLFVVSGSNLEINASGLAAGAYTVEISVSATNATNTPQIYTITVQLAAISTATRVYTNQPGGNTSVWNTPFGAGATWSAASDADTIALLKGTPYINPPSNYGCIINISDVAGNPTATFTGNDGNYGYQNGAGLSWSVTIGMVPGAASPGPFPANVDQTFIGYDTIGHPGKVYMAGPVQIQDFQAGQGPYTVSSLDVLDCTLATYAEPWDLIGLASSTSNSASTGGPTGVIRLYDIDSTQNPAYPNIQHGLSVGLDISQVKSNTNSNTTVNPAYPNGYLNPNSWPNLYQDYQSGSNIYTGTDLLFGQTFGIPLSTPMPTTLTAEGQALWWNAQHYPWIHTYSAGGGLHLIVDQEVAAYGNGTWLANANKDLPTILQYLRILRNQHQGGADFTANPRNGPGNRVDYGPPALATVATTPITPSANYATVIAPSTAALTDSSGNVWTITSGAQVALNGVAVSSTAYVTEIAYVNGSIWQLNSFGDWYQTLSVSGTTVTYSTGTTTSPLPVIATNTTIFGVYVESNAAQGVYPNDQQWTSYEAWLGAKIPLGNIFTGDGGQSDFDNPGYDLGVAGFYQTGRIVTVSASMLYQVPAGSGKFNSLAQAAAGDLNNDYTAQANAILNFFCTNGTSGGLNQSVIYVRIGWEQNGGGMPWAVNNVPDQQNFIGAFQAMVTQWRNAQAAFAPPSGITTPTFKFVWCPNWNGNDPSLTWPGSAYVDVVGMDMYVQVNTGQPGTPAANWQHMLTASYGLNWLTQWATTYNKPIAFPEWGINQDGWGDWLKLFVAFCNANNCLFANYWWSEAGGYPGVLGGPDAEEGTPSNQYPATAAMYRYLINPSVYPIDPDTQPGAPYLAIVPGNGTATLIITPSTPGTAGAITGYNLYRAATSGGETTAQAITLSGGQYIVSNLTNSDTYYFVVSAVNSAGEGIKSLEQSCTPSATASTAPSVVFGSAGYATSPYPSSLQGINLESLDIAVDFVPTAADLSTPSATLLAVWGPSGYNQSFFLILGENGSTSGVPIVAWHDNSGNTNVITANVPSPAMVAGSAYTVRAVFNPTGGSAQFYLNRLGATQSALGSTNTATAGIHIGTASTNPYGTVPLLMTGNDLSYQSHFQGAVLAIRVSVNGNQVVGSSATSAGLIDNFGITWTLVDGAVPSTKPVAASANNTIVMGTNGSIVDASGNVWTINASEVVVFNGVPATSTSNAVELAYVNSVVWQLNSAGNWYSVISTSPVEFGNQTTTSPLPPPSANKTVITTVGPSIRDTNNNLWTITSGGQMALNGTALSNTSNVVELAYVNSVVYQENSSSEWYAVTAVSGTTVTFSTGSTTSPLSSGSGTASSNFSVKNGVIYDINGNLYVASGVNAIGPALSTISTNNSAQPLTTLFPGINHVRVPVFPSDPGQPDSIYPQPSSFLTFVQQLTGYTLNGSTWSKTNNNGIVVEIEDHNQNTQNASYDALPPYTGGGLTTQLNWYAAMATYYAGNPYVWLGGPNEIASSDGTYSQNAIAAISTWEGQIYNAIRNGTGFNNMIQFMAGVGGSNIGTVGVGSGFSSAVYANMTNICWEIHCYYSTGDTGSGNYNSAISYVQGGTSAPSSGGGGGWGITGAQTIRSADGLVPVIIGEWGSDSGSPGTTEAAPITAAISSVQSQGVGATAWAYWQSDSQAWALVNGAGNGLTTWGNEMASTLPPATPTIDSISLSNDIVANNPASGTVVGAISVTMASGSFTGTLSLSGTNASSFRIVGANLETNG